MAAKKKATRHRSALKAHRQSLKRYLRNRAVRKGIREASRAATDAAKAKDAKAADLLAQACATLDKAVGQGSLHWKAAARKKSRLAKRAAVLSAAAAPAKA